MESLYYWLFRNFNPNRRAFHLMGAIAFYLTAKKHAKRGNWGMVLPQLKEIPSQIWWAMRKGFDEG